MRTPDYTPEDLAAFLERHPELSWLTEETVVTGSKFAWFMIGRRLKAAWKPEPPVDNVNPR